MKLPLELLEKVFFYSGLETVILLNYQSLFKKLYIPGKHTRDWAIVHNYMLFLKWMIKNNLGNFTIHSANIACKQKNLECLKLLYSIDNKFCNYSTYLIALENGNIDILDWLRSINLKFCNCECMDWAARENDLRLLKWLYANHEHCKPNVAVRWAEKNNNYKMTDWLNRRLYRRIKT